MVLGGESLRAQHRSGKVEVVQIVEIRESEVAQIVGVVVGPGPRKMS